MGSRRILVTGAEGVIGSAVRQHLAGRYELTSLTLTAQEFPSHVADVSDLESIRPAFEGVDAVVHLAASASLEASWDDVLRNNIVGTYNVFEAARLAGVSRVLEPRGRHVRAGRRAGAV
jgi:NAD+ dependent glucose-6-phosphate dehydrogenase